MAEPPRGRLVLVPNTLDFGAAEPLPDLETVLPRGVISVAARLEHWVAENARTTRAFLKRVSQVVPLARPLQDISIVELPRPAKGGQRPGPTADGAYDALLRPAVEGHDVGLISEAGMPAVADPGAALVAAAHAAGIAVTPLVGPSAILLAVAASGLNGQSFAFVGYLPVDATARQARIVELENLSRRQGQTQVAIETPYRNGALLAALLAALKPETRLSVSCGLTLDSESTLSRRVAEWRRASVTLPSDTPAVFAFQAN